MVVSIGYITIVDVNDGANAIVAVLSNEVHTVPTDSAGNNGVFTGANTTMTIYNGTADDSANWTVTATVSNVTGSLSGKTYTVTDLSADTGYVDLTAARSGYASIVKRFVLTKSKAGVTGAQGPAGPAVVVTANRALTFTATDGALDGSQADIVLTAAVSGITSPTYAWTFSGLQTNPTASTTNSQTITAAQFGTSKAATVTCTVNGSFVDQVTIVRLEKSTAEAGATKNTIYRQSTTPSGATNGDIWIDTSITPNVEKLLISGTWQVAATVGATFATGQAGSIAGQITGSNVTTYIANAAIDTLQIKGNAVVVPTSFTVAPTLNSYPSSTSRTTTKTLFTYTTSNPNNGKIVITFTGTFATNAYLLFRYAVENEGYTLTSTSTTMELLENDVVIQSRTTNQSNTYIWTADVLPAFTIQRNVEAGTTYTYKIRATTTSSRPLTHTHENGQIAVLVLEPRR